MSEFDEYKRLGEPEKKEKSEIWQTAIGLQKVDGLTPSAYLIETARSNIQGDITIDEVKCRINSYYQAKPLRANTDERTEEADKVSAQIAAILSEKSFTFSPAEYITIHKRLFSGIYKFAGKIRDYNISKAEWALNGETVIYAGAESIRATLDYDFNQEKTFQYKGLSDKQIVQHISKFVSSLWQIHIFGEGNTRTTAVFTIKYLRSFGFDVTNDLFAEHSWYFRNALVRANYNDYKRNIFSTQKYLDCFFYNLLLGEKNELKNRELLVSRHIDTVNDTVNLQIDTVNDTVLTLIKENPHITSNAIAEKLLIGIATAKRQIKKLKDSGVIERIGSDKTGYWNITKDKN